MLKKTKIVCTIGPASRDADTMREMLEAGHECSAAQLFSRNTRGTS